MLQAGQEKAAFGNGMRKRKKKAKTVTERAAFGNGN
jgi:hypothetical protein